MPTGKKKSVPKPKLQTLIQIEKLSAGATERALCAKCGLHASCAQPFLQPLVPDNWTGKLLLVGELQPEFERSGNLYQSLGGRELQRVFKEAGIARKDVAFMPVLRCRPNKAPSMHQLRACAPFVYRAVQVLKPVHILAMGPNAVKSLSNKGTPGPVARLRGRLKEAVYEGGSFTYWVTASLHQLGTSPNEIARFTEDIQRFFKTELEYPIHAVPKAASFLGFDTEYTPSQVLCGALSDGRHAVTVEAQSLGRVAPLLARSIIVGHNLPVDLDALLKAKVPGLEVAMEQWLQGRKQRDTLLLAKMSDENRGKGAYTLEALLVAHYNTKDYKAPTEVLGPDPTLWPLPLRDERCRLDAWATLKVFEATEDRARGPQAITHAIAMTLHRMKYIGVYVSMAQYQKMKKEVYQEEQKAKVVLLAHARKHGLTDFSPTKDADVRTLVYDKLGLEIETRTKGGLPSASAKVLKEYKDAYPEIMALLAYSKADKLKTTYCDGLEKKFERQPDGRFWLPVYINPLAAKTGRRASAGPNFQNQPVRVRQIIVSRFPAGVIADNDYCVAPGTRVLCSDLTWKAAQDIRRNDRVVGFDEVGTKRKFRDSRVTSVKQLTRPCYKITTDKGVVTASAEHKWLARTLPSYKSEWVLTSDIRTGHTISFLAKPWEVEHTQEAGYLAGFLDGEGFVSGSTGFGQNKGEVSTYVQELLRRRGFTLNSYTSKGSKCEQLLVDGPLGERLRLLGTIRPKRLLPKGKSIWEGKQTWGNRSKPAAVIAVEYVGEQNVIAIGTTSSTFIAEGLFSHNSKLEPVAGGWVTGEHRLTEYFTKYPNGYIKIGKDFFNKEVEKNTKEYTLMKSLVLAILYNKKKWSLADDLWSQGCKLDNNYDKHIDESGVILDRFLSKLFPGVREYHRRQEELVLTHGYVDNAVGQRRRLPLPPEPPRSDKMAYKIYMRFKAHVINQAINYPIQSLASYVTGSALIDLERAFLTQFKLTYLEFQQRIMAKQWPTMPLICIEVHDDLVLDIPKGMEKKTKEVTHDIMCSVPSLRKLLPAFDTPLSVDTNMGPMWGLKT